jgi:AcrR family transcriptional regulator
MTKAVKRKPPEKKRSYTSAVRQEQAAQTRARILDAARRLFVEKGFARTTVQDIASTAAVAADTVYAVFGSKARVLTALIDLHLVPDGSVANVTELPAAQAMRDETDQRKQLELFAEFITAISTHLRPIFEILRTASAVEPDMAAVHQEMDRFRLKNMHQYAAWVAARGPLRVDTERAGEIMWAVTSPDVARMLCDELGWSQQQHADWLADTLKRSLLLGDS